MFNIVNSKIIIIFNNGYESFLLDKIVLCQLFNFLNIFFYINEFYLNLHIF